MAVSKSRNKDFCQIGYLNVTESAATTLTFNGLSVFSNVLGQKGMIISRAEYVIPSSNRDLLIAAGDYIKFGLAGDDSKTSISLSDPEIYDYNLMQFDLRGTAGNGNIVMEPVVKDWCDLPGGGLLVPADRLYAYVEGISIASACTLTVRFWYNIIDLSAQDYLELAQAMRVLK